MLPNPLAPMADKGGTGISIGNFDLGIELIENRIRLMVMQEVVNRLIRDSRVDISQDDIDQLRQEAIDQLNEEYPQLGVEGE